MARVKVFSGDVDDIARFVADCEKAGLVGRKHDAVMNLLGQIREDHLEDLKKVRGVIAVEVREHYTDELS
jgi:hypothetical protein